MSGADRQDPGLRVVIDGRELIPWEVHVIRTAVTVYLTDIVTGDRVIVTGQAEWVRHLENVTRYLCGGAHLTEPVLATPSPAELKLKAIEDYVRKIGATGDWSVASPILEMIGGDI